VVLSVIGIVVGMSVPALVGYSRQVRLKTATREVIGLISLARSLAISSRAERAVVVDVEREEIRVVDVASGEALEEVVRLPSTVSVELRIGGELTSETQFVFRPSGALAGRTVSFTLVEGDRRKTIVITGPTGAVAIQKSEDG
jgi:Tfp pilus assembly protein FimT